MSKPAMATITEADLRIMRNDLDFYRRAYKSQQVQLDKMPRGSFIAIQLLGVECKAKKQRWKCDMQAHICDGDGVRKNNELRRVFKYLCEHYYGGNIKYIEEGITKEEVSHENTHE